MTKVVITCDTNPDYMYYLPINIAFWQERFGYQVVLGLVGSADQWGKNDLCQHVLNTIKKIAPGTEFIFLDSFNLLPSYCVALMMRFFIPLRFPEDFCFTWDVDMLALNKEYYQPSLDKAVHYYNPGVLGDPPYKLAAGHLGALGCLWREILGIESYENITQKYIKKILMKYKSSWFERLRSLFLSGKDNMHKIKFKNVGFWDIDQLYLSDILLAGKHKDKLKIVGYKRDVDYDTMLLRDRIDRANWQFDHKKKDYYIDVHSVIDNSWDMNLKQWGVLKEILDLYINSRSQLISDYTCEFGRILRGSN